MQTLDEVNVAAVPAPHRHCHAVCWRSIFAGAVTAAVTSLVLLALGSGIGLASFTPFGDTETIASFTVKTAIWMIVMQWFSAAFGGYLAGRLRKKHVRVHADESFFRDTAHGFLSWAVATLLMATLLTSTAAALVGGGAKAATAITASAAAGAAAKPETAKAAPYSAYDFDVLFRSGSAAAAPADSNAEAIRIVANGIKTDTFPDEDRQYLAQMVVARTGVTAEEANDRVNTLVTRVETAKAQAIATADDARKAAAAFSVFTVLSMLIGAFIASTAAAIGGRHRDIYVV